MDETLWFTLDDDRLTVAADEADVDDVEEFRTDDPTMAARAAALDDHDVYSAMFTAVDGDVVVTARPADIVLGQWSHVIETRTFPPG
jgi:hypothetical protein